MSISKKFPPPEDPEQRTRLEELARQVGRSIPTAHRRAIEFYSHRNGSLYIVKEDSGDRIAAVSSPQEDRYVVAFADKNLVREGRSFERDSAQKVVEDLKIAINDACTNEIFTKNAGKHNKSGDSIFGGVRGNLTLVCSIVMLSGLLSICSDKKSHGHDVLEDDKDGAKEGLSVGADQAKPPPPELPVEIMLPEELEYEERSDFDDLGL